jgi:hypothetical protein
MLVDACIVEVKDSAQAIMVLIGKQQSDAKMEFEEEEEEPIVCEACGSDNIILSKSTYECLDCANEGIYQYKRRR